MRRALLIVLGLLGALAVSALGAVVLFTQTTGGASACAASRWTR
jgi:hypothetical protein